MPDFPSGSNVRKRGSRLSRQTGRRSLRTTSSSGQDDASGTFDADESQSSPPTSIAHTDSDSVMGQQCDRRVVRSGDSLHSSSSDLTMRTRTIEDQQPLAPESYGTRLKYNVDEGHWGLAKVPVASTLGDRDPSGTGSGIDQEDNSSILSETGTKPLTIQRPCDRSTYLYEIGEEIEKQANRCFDHRGKVSWVICDFPDGAGSTNEGIVGHIKGMHYYEHDTWVLILTALQFLVPSYALPNQPSQTRGAHRGPAPERAVKLPDRNIQILLQFQGSALKNLEKRVDELENDILGQFTAKITGVVRSALRDRIGWLWTPVKGQIPRFYGQELSPFRAGERVWKMY